MTIKDNSDGAQPGGAPGFRIKVQRIGGTKHYWALLLGMTETTVTAGTLSPCSMV